MTITKPTIRKVKLGLHISYNVTLVSFQWFWLQMVFNKCIRVVYGSKYGYFPLNDLLAQSCLKKYRVQY